MRATLLLLAIPASISNAIQPRHGLPVLRDVFHECGKLCSRREECNRCHPVIVLRGGASLGPLRFGPLVIDARVGPRSFVYLNALAGLMYSLSLVGLDPSVPDPTLKYWQQEQTVATRAILQFLALALLWINGFMLYAMLFMGARAEGLLKFQSFGWISVMSLMAFQVNAYGCKALLGHLGATLPSA